MDGLRLKMLRVISYKWTWNVLRVSVSAAEAIATALSNGRERK